MARRFITLAVLPLASPMQDRNSALPAWVFAAATKVGLKTAAQRVSERAAGRVRNCGRAPLHGPHQDAPASRMTSLSVEASAASNSSSLVTWSGA
jgi:hypothetical protein